MLYGIRFFVPTSEEIDFTSWVVMSIVSDTLEVDLNHFQKPYSHEMDFSRIS
jgi:hypothetical protein